MCSRRDSSGERQSHRQTQPPGPHGHNRYCRTHLHDGASSSSSWIKLLNETCDVVLSFPIFFFQRSPKASLHDDTAQTILRFFSPVHSSELTEKGEKLVR